MSIIGNKFVTDPGVDWRLELSLGALEEAEFPGVWDLSVYDTDQYSGQEIYWADVTPRLIQAGTSRGRDRWGSRFRVGTMALLLDNQDGVFNPDYSGIELGQLNLRPGRWARISAKLTNEPTSEYVPVYTGVIEDIEDLYTDGGHGINSQINVVDLFARLSIDNPPAIPIPIPTGQRTDQRVFEILVNQLDWPPELLEADVADHTMQASTLPNSRLEECQRAADAEGGAFYFDARSVARFRNNTWLEDGPNEGTVQYNAGGDNDDIKVIDADTDWGMGNIVNDVQMSRAGGSAQRVIGSTSQALYGPRTFRRLDLENETDLQVLNLANQRVDQFQYDRLEVKSVSLVATTEATAKLLMATDVGWRIRVTIELPTFSYTADVWVNTVAHTIKNDNWIVRLNVDNVDTGNPFEGGAFSEGFGVGFNSLYVAP